MKRRLQARLFFMAVLAGFFILSGCSPTFLVSRECETYFFGSPKLNSLLCPTGDLQRIIGSTSISPRTGEELLNAQCTDRSADEVHRIYQGLSDKEKSELKSSFSRHGYDVNYMPAPNYRLGYGTGREYLFCPPPG